MATDRERLRLTPDFSAWLAGRGITREEHDRGEGTRVVWRGLEADDTRGGERELQRLFSEFAQRPGQSLAQLAHTDTDPFSYFWAQGFFPVEYFNDPALPWLMRAEGIGWINPKYETDFTDTEDLLRYWFPGAVREAGGLRIQPAQPFTQPFYYGEGGGFMDKFGWVLPLALVGVGLAFGAITAAAAPAVVAEQIAAPVVDASLSWLAPGEIVRTGAGVMVGGAAGEPLLASTLIQAPAPVFDAAPALPSLPPSAPLSPSSFLPSPGTLKTAAETAAAAVTLARIIDLSVDGEGTALPAPIKPAPAAVTADAWWSLGGLLVAAALLWWGFSKKAT